MRTGALGALVLAMRSLVVGYKAPAGNKPLARTGRLDSMATRRLHETSKFVYSVSLPDGMAHDSEGFEITVRVRVMHAMVRELLRDSGTWDEQAWGAPSISMTMVATTQLFSTILLQGLSSLGASVSARDAQETMALWRYVGWVIGVEEDLLPRTFEEGELIMEIIEATQYPPDEDARRLVGALFGRPTHPSDARSE